MSVSDSLFLVALDEIFWLLPCEIFVCEAGIEIDPIIPEKYSQSSFSEEDSIILVTQLERIV